MNKILLLLTLTISPILTHAQPIHGHYSTDGDMGYEADGLDEWDLPAGQTLESALADFRVKCSTEIPAAVARNFPALEISSEDFSFVTRVDLYYARGLGKSYRCYMHVVSNARDKYKFTEWKASNTFYDIFDNKGNVSKTAYEQCKEYSTMLDSRVPELKLFDRHSLLTWVTRRNPVTGRNGVNTECYVTYIQLQGGADPSRK